MILKKRYKKVIREMLGRGIRAELGVTGINYYIWFGKGVGWILVYYYISGWKELKILDKTFYSKRREEKYLAYMKIFKLSGLEGLMDEIEKEV